MSLSIHAKLALFAVGLAGGCLGGYYASGYHKQKKEAKKLLEQLATQLDPKPHATTLK